MRKAQSAKSSKMTSSYAGVSSDYQSMTTSLQSYMQDEQAEDEDDDHYGARTGAAAQELAAELGVYSAPALQAAFKSKRRAAPTLPPPPSAGAGSAGAGSAGAGSAGAGAAGFAAEAEAEADEAACQAAPDDAAYQAPDDAAYQVYDVDAGAAVSAGLAVAESENAVEQLAQTVAPVAEDEMLSLLDQLVVEPAEDEERAALFKLFEANQATVEAARGLLFNFWGECEPDFAEHGLVKAAISSDMQKIDSAENMGINFDDTRVWFVLSMSRAVTRNNTVIDGVLKTIRTKLELLGSQDECPICFEALEGRPSVALGCAHAVCTECWGHWERAQAAQHRRAFCPLCKNEDFISSVLTYAAV